jgi:hypothetical protein
MSTIEVYPKNGQINWGEIRATLTEKYEYEFDIDEEKRTVTAYAYYGLAVEILNELGYETDEDELPEE